MAEEYKIKEWIPSEIITADALNNLENNIKIISAIYNNQTNYNKGDYCLYNGKLWRCIQSCSGEPPLTSIEDNIQNSNYWTETHVMDESNAINDIKNNYIKIDDIGHRLLKNYPLRLGTISAGGSSSADAWVSITSSKHQHILIPISTSDQITITTQSQNNSNLWYAFLTDDSEPQNGDAPLCENTHIAYLQLNQTITLTPPADAKFLFLQLIRNNVDCTPAKLVINNFDQLKNLTQNINTDIQEVNSNIDTINSDIQDINSNINALTDKYNEMINQCAFIATDGNDTTGDGTITAPYATIDYALSTGARNIILRQGIYSQTINLSNIYGTIHISSYDHTEKVIFMPDSAKIVVSSTPHAGYTKIRKAQISTNKPINIKIPWLFQDSIADVATEISIEERHSLQRGKECRSDDTKILQCTATGINDALAEIESTQVNEYKWFYDDTESTLYFNCPDTTVDTIICQPQPTKLFNNNHRGVTIDCSGIELKYMSLNIDSSNNSIITDCKVSNAACEGGFSYNRSLNATFKRCEAANTIYRTSNNSLTGDGFNGKSQNTGETFSKQTTVTLIDCWSHDNYDDGYSDHQRSETTIFGGLYEWNGKAGITPSYGSHCTAYNVMSRHNYNGFLVAGEANDGGVGTQGIFINCISENNTRGDSTNAGFAVSGNLNSVFCYNCISNNNKIGYYAYNNGKVYLSNCIDDGLIKTSQDSTGSVSIVSNDIIQASKSLELDNLTGCTRYNGLFLADGKWGNINSNYQHVVIPAEPGMKLTLEGNNTSFYYAIVTKYNTPIATAPTYCSAYEPYTVRLSGGNNSTHIRVLPPDTKYVLIATKNNGTDVTPKTFSLIYESNPPIKWCALGDSITQGIYSSFESTATPTDTNYAWAPRVAALKGWSLTNLAIGGTGFIDPVNQLPAEPTEADYKRGWWVAKNTDFTQYNIVTVAYGINDYKGNQPLGKLDTAYDNVDTPNSVYASIQSIITSILGSSIDTNSTSKPSIKLIFITPLNIYKQNNTYYGSYGTNYALGQLNNAKDADDSSINAPYTLEDLFNAIVECCEYYGVEYIDMTHRSIINRQNIRHLLPDGVHPSLEAHKVLAQELSKKINF